VAVAPHNIGGVNGRRLPLDAEGKITQWPENPGDYVGPVMGYTDDKPAVFFLKPNARDGDVAVRARAVQHVTSPPHTFTEEPDGTLTISASISNLVADDTTGESDDGWHGYLERGIWRQV
jgi:hypothetical protein